MQTKKTSVQSGRPREPREPRIIHIYLVKFYWKGTKLITIFLTGQTLQFKTVKATISKK